MRNSFTLTVFGCLLVLPLFRAAAAPSRPNIIVILSDDMGFSDIGCYGGEIRTPNLDALAKGGVRFTQFYNMARCCPTRASLLTGLYPHQAGVGHMMEDRELEGYRGRLNQNCVTVAEALKPAGYRSYAVGKWHVTPGESARALASTNNWPLQRGFDRHYGTIHGAGSFWDPSSLVRDNQLITAANDLQYPSKDYYYTDAISDHAVRFLRDHVKGHAAQPFFLYVAYTAAHWPMHARESDIAKYKGRYSAGYEAIRAERWAKQKQLGLVDPKWEPSRLVGDWSKVKDQAFEEHCMEVYAAMVDCMDQGIGRVVAELKTQGQFDNTFILYLHDNGGCAENVGRGTNATVRGNKPTLPPMAPEDQQFSSQPKQTRDGWPVRQGYGVMPGGPDTYIAYGREWANVSNTPFREYKHWTHEGGISTPLIAHWPAGIAASRRDKLESKPAHLIDIMATCIDLAGATYPKERGGEKIKPMEGVSLGPLLAGKSVERAQPIFWEHEGNRAVRDGRWKLVSKENQPWELYDMESDRTELHDLANSEPSKASELAAQWDAYAARANVLPLGAWRGKGTTTAANNVLRNAANNTNRVQEVRIKKDDTRAIIGTVESFDPRFDLLVPKSAQLEQIADGFIWTEGAVWNKPGQYLLFSDIPNNVVIQWIEDQGTSEHIKPSGYTGERPRGGKAGDEPGSNGLGFDTQGRLLLCQHGDRRVVRIEKDGTKTVLADRYQGKRLNSPNDLTIHPNGDIFFTDPAYGLAKWDTKELDFTGVFRISVGDGQLHLVSRDLRPNGIALSPNGKTLYVTSGRNWMAFPVNEDGSTGDGRVFADSSEWNLTPAKGGGIDGLKVDVQGNLFATGPGGVCVIAPDGTLLGRFLTGDRTANLCFGGEDGQTLFVCVNHRIGKVRVTTRGIGW